MKKPLLSAGLAVATCAAGLLVPATALPASAAGPPAAAPSVPAPPPSDVRELPPDSKVSTRGLGLSSAQQRGLAPRALAAGVTPPVGTVRQWLGLDDVQGILYRKDYTLRGVGDHIEVWVANDTPSRPATAAARSRTRRRSPTPRSTRLVNEFDTNMYPKETAAFSTPPDRDGTNADSARTPTATAATTPATATRPSRWSTTSATTTTTLPGRARPTSPGFFSSQFNELLDRNVMTIDAFDWAHRTGANPPDEPTADLCTSRPARPRTLRGHLRPRVAAPAAVLHRPGRDDLGQRGPLRLRADADRVRRRAPRRSSTPAPTATSTASRASAPCRRRSTPTRATAAARRTR